MRVFIAFLMLFALLAPAGLHAQQSTTYISEYSSHNNPYPSLKLFALVRQQNRRGLLKGEQIHALARDVGYGKRVGKCYSLR